MADIQMQPEQQENAPVDAAPVPQNQGFVHSVVKMIPLGETTLNAAVWTYDTVKHSNSLLEGACNNVEGKVSRTIDTVVVRPAEAVAGVYNAGVENAKWAVNTTTSTAKHAGILSIGAGVLATQLSLQLAATGASYALDGVGMAQRGGRRVYTSIKELGEVVETMVWAAIEEAKTLGHIPVEKAAEYSHAFLDIARALMERGLAIDIGDETNLNLRERVTNMATVIASALHQKANDHVLLPLNGQAHNLQEQISKGLILVDLVRSQGHWALEKVETLSSSVADLKARLEAEAQEYKTQPEAALMRFIRSNATQLMEQLQQLKEKGKQIYGDGTFIDGALDYLHRLDQQLSQSQDIYQVSDAVLAEARVRLADITAWTAGLLRRQ